MIQSSILTRSLESCSKKKAVLDKSVFGSRINAGRRFSSLLLHAEIGGAHIGVVQDLVTTPFENRSTVF